MNDIYMFITWYSGPVLELQNHSNAYIVQGCQEKMVVSQLAMEYFAAESLEGAACKMAKVLKYMTSLLE